MPEQGLSFATELADQRRERERAERQSQTPEQRREAELAGRLDPPFPYSVVGFPVEYLVAEG